MFDLFSSQIRVISNTGIHSCLINSPDLSLETWLMIPVKGCPNLQPPICTTFPTKKTVFRGPTCIRRIAPVGRGKGGQIICWTAPFLILFSFVSWHGLNYPWAKRPSDICIWKFRVFFGAAANAKVQPLFI